MTSKNSPQGAVASAKKRNKVLRGVLALLVVVLVALLGTAGYIYFRADHALTDMKREALLPTQGDVMGTETPTAPTPPDPNAGTPINYLLLGSDTRGEGDKGRSDSILLAHLPADRSKLYLISFPRDLYVKIPGHAKQKINAAYELGGAPYTVRTVEALTGAPIHHVALVDFQGFISLVRDLGGVTIDNPYGGCDSSQHLCFEKGVQVLNNERALQYVRWRHGLPNGDITRGENQQRVLKAIASKTLSAGTLTDPMKLTNIIETLSKNITVDQSLDNNTIKATALNLRITSSEDIRSLVAPIKGYYSHPTYGDVDMVDEARMEELRQALESDNLDAYWMKYKDAPVAGDATVDETQVSQDRG